MLHKKKSFFTVLICLFFLQACKKTETTPTPPPPPYPCLGVTITPVASKTYTITGQSLASITVNSPIGAGYQYSIGAGFQASPNFANLATGDYTVTVKNADSCKGTTPIAIVGYGPKFYNVKTIVLGYCGPCHLNGGNSGGKNFDSDANITAAWDRIKARTVDGTPSFMPQGGQLTALDKQKIADWVTAGHRTTD